jgi:hypothetical protein
MSQPARIAKLNGAGRPQRPATQRAKTSLDEEAFIVMRGGADAKLGASSSIGIVTIK